MEFQTKGELHPQVVGFTLTPLELGAAAQLIMQERVAGFQVKGLRHVQTGAVTLMTPSVKMMLGQFNLQPPLYQT